jgi:hypothetical protein
MTLCSLINVAHVSEVPIASIVRVEDGGSRYLGNVDNCLPDYMLS